MGSMFGGDSSSDEMLRMQKQEAAEARIKNEQKTARINAGLARINALFGKKGEEIMKAGPGKAFDWKTFKDPTSEMVQDIYAGKTQQIGGNLPAGYSYQQLPDGTWTVRHGKDIYKKGEKFNYADQVGTGKFKGGFGNDFYDKFKEGIEGYYLPQVAEKYGDAKLETKYRLARAGLLQSSAATDAYGDLVKQNDIQVGTVRDKADAGAADLLNRVNTAKSTATNQLYSTENPDVAVNQALGSIRNITAAPTDLSPLGDVFQLATIGAAGGIKGYQDAKFMAANPDIFNRSGSGRIV